MSANRAFLYGDGLFETLRFEKQRLALWPYHYQRLREGLAQLQMPLSADADTLHFWIAQQLPATRQALRLRLTAYRAGGGRYTPERNQPAFQLQVEEYPLVAHRPLVVQDKVELAPARLALAPSAISPLKSLNALPYVLAAQHLQAQAWAHILLCSTAGYLAEAEAYNLFWRIGDRIYTPSLASGCVAGVCRKWSMELLEKEGYVLKEGLYRSSVLEKADEIWLCNALQGMRSLGHWQGRELEHSLAYFLQQHYAALYA